jgi:hypothetical protein
VQGKELVDGLASRGVDSRLAVLLGRLSVGDYDIDELFVNEDYAELFKALVLNSTVGKVLVSKKHAFFETKNNKVMVGLSAEGGLYTTVVMSMSASTNSIAKLDLGGASVDIYETTEDYVKSTLGYDHEVASDEIVISSKGKYRVLDDILVMADDYTPDAIISVFGSSIGDVIYTSFIAHISDILNRHGLYAEAEYNGYNYEVVVHTSYSYDKAKAVISMLAKEFGVDSTGDVTLSAFLDEYGYVRIHAFGDGHSGLLVVGVDIDGVEPGGESAIKTTTVKSPQGLHPIAIVGTTAVVLVYGTISSGVFVPVAVGTVGGVQVQSSYYGGYYSSSSYNTETSITAIDLDKLMNTKIFQELLLTIREKLSTLKTSVTAVYGDYEITLENASPLLQPITITLERPTKLYYALVPKVGTVPDFYVDEKSTITIRKNKTKRTVKFDKPMLAKIMTINIVHHYVQRLLSEIRMQKLGYA